MKLHNLNLVLVHNDVGDLSPIEIDVVVEEKTYHAYTCAFHATNELPSLLASTIRLACDKTVRRGRLQGIKGS